MTFLEAVKIIMGHSAIQTSVYFEQQKNEDRQPLFADKRTGEWSV